LSLALSRAGYPIAGIASRSRGDAQSIVDRSDVVFLTVPDDAIAAVCASLRWKGQAAVHCSGALELDVLDIARRQGAAVGSFHPLQTFPYTPQPQGADTTWLAGATVAIEAEGSLLETLTSMAEALGCRAFRVPAGRKALYHASAALASNYLVTLVAEAAGLWRQLGASEGDALAALLPLARATVANVERLGPETALTGPIARGDSGTVRRHLKALERFAPDLVPLYRDLGRRTVRLAHLDPDAETDLNAVLIPKETQPCV
jgi:predicted short-subunit dehydrogenase-like oxidoreductase (DUF2520 family)